MLEDQDKYTFVELAEVISKQNNVRMSTAFNYISSNKNGRGSKVFYESKNDQFYVIDWDQVALEIRDPNVKPFE